MRSWTAQIDLTKIGIRWKRLVRMNNESGDDIEIYWISISGIL